MSRWSPWKSGIASSLGPFEWIYFHLQSGPILGLVDITSALRWPSSSARCPCSLAVEFWQSLAWFTGWTSSEQIFYDCICTMSRCSSLTQGTLLWWFLIFLKTFAPLDIAGQLIQKSACWRHPASSNMWRSLRGAGNMKLANILFLSKEDCLWNFKHTDASEIGIELIFHVVETGKPK